MTFELAQVLNISIISSKHYADYCQTRGICGDSPLRVFSARLSILTYIRLYISVESSSISIVVSGMSSPAMSCVKYYYGCGRAMSRNLSLE